MAGTITVEGAVNGLLSGSVKFGPATITGSSTAAGQVVACPLIAGANTITVPAGTTAVAIFPPSSSAVTLQLKGTTGDTGFYLSPKSPTVLPFDQNNMPGTIVLVAGAAMMVDIGYI